MITKRYFREKNFSLIGLLSFLTSCFMINNLNNSNNQELVAHTINDYLVDYNHYNDKKKLEALLVFVEVKDDDLYEVIVQDYPLTHLFNDIRKEKISENYVTFGLYKNKPIKFISNIDSDKLTSFIEKDKLLVTRAQKLPEFYDKKGNQFNLSGIPEYEPLLISKYHLAEQTKTLELIDGQINKDKYFLY